MDGGSLARLQHDKRWQIQQWVHYRKFSPALGAPLANPGPAKGSGSVTPAHGWPARGTDLCEKYTCTEQTCTCNARDVKPSQGNYYFFKFVVKYLENCEIELNFSLLHANDERREQDTIFFSLQVTVKKGRGV